MSEITPQRIATAEMLPGLGLRLTFADGFQGIADLTSLAAQGGVPAVVAADPSGFVITRHGRTVAWLDAEGDEVDFCADALRLITREQPAPTE